ncbi:MAG: ATP-binding protein [Gammaproteobacteria bacterium]|nr:ATP-binding protein [Gammaproteobacteria bacterium]
MKHISQIIDADSDGAGIQYRRKPYGASGVREFLRDVLAMANAPIVGTRHIIVGVDIDTGGNRNVDPVSDGDFGTSPDYMQLAKEHIEPALDISYAPSLLDGKKIGVFEIGDSRDRPYMMRVSYSETLQLGDAYIRVDNTAVKMGRAQLQALFEQNYQTSVSADNVEIGFAGDKIQEALALSCRDLSELPSTVATRKLEELMKASGNQASGSTSMVVRLAHARLYGSDEPYVSRSPEEVMLELDQVGFKYAEQDKQFLFGMNAQMIQAAIHNHGSEAITNAILELALPKDSEFFVTDRPPSMSQASNDDAIYPEVTLRDNVTRISQKIGVIPAGASVDVFTEPLRVFAGNALRGRRFRIHYALRGQNLRSTIKGRLRLMFNA